MQNKINTSLSYSQHRAKNSPKHETSVEFASSGSRGNGNKTHNNGNREWQKRDNNYQNDGRRSSYSRKGEYRGEHGEKNEYFSDRPDFAWKKKESSDTRGYNATGSRQRPFQSTERQGSYHSDRPQFQRSDRSRGEDNGRRPYMNSERKNFDRGQRSDFFNNEFNYDAKNKEFRPFSNNKEGRKVYGINELSQSNALNSQNTPYENATNTEPVASFAAFTTLPNLLLDSLNYLKFEVPTPIQSQVIPHALAGRDVLASAQTGSGKTAAFAIPVIAKLLENPESSALIVVPTRELAQQVKKVCDELLGKRRSSIRTALLIGGEKIFRQFAALRANPRLVVGTPGRIIDHIQQNSLDLTNTTTLVLDEADRMLDMGFTPQINAILEFIPANRQTLLFSATFPKKVAQIARQYLDNPIRVTVEKASNSHEKLKHTVIHVKEQEKQQKLVDLLQERAEESVIIFVKKKFTADEIADFLRTHNHAAQAIHGDLSHRKRESVMHDFRKLRSRIIVATDVAARGIDISHVGHVINFDLPQCPEDYIHRIGRTARAGREGEAVCMVTPAERSKWSMIDRIMKQG